MEEKRVRCPECRRNVWVKRVLYRSQNVSVFELTCGHTMEERKPPKPRVKKEESVEVVKVGPSLLPFPDPEPEPPEFTSTEDCLGCQHGADKAEFPRIHTCE